MDRGKLVVIGLDCATPGLFFDKHVENVPIIKCLQAVGTRGQLRSSDPPITIPAWMCMATGRTPGQLGVYGFKHLRKGTHDKAWIATSSSIREPTAWELLSHRGYRSIIVGVPPTYPVKPFNGQLVSCFITPGVENEFTHPPSLKQDILSKFGTYTFDVPFRIENKADLFAALMDMTRKRHEVVMWLLQEREWDLAWLVEIGLDRMHHAFWKYFDPRHKDHIAGNPYQDYIHEYERLLDKHVNDILEVVPPDTTVMVVSDHGAQPMDGCVCVNEWLHKEGYLALRTRPAGIVPPEKLDVDWSRTRAIGWGGYYARIFLNVQGRDPDGVIPLARYDQELQALRAKLESMPGPDGAALGTRTFTSGELYPEGHVGDDPDLYVYFGDLRWRSAGTFGHGTLFLDENDTGPDDAVHAKQGIFIAATKRQLVECSKHSHDEIDSIFRHKPVNQYSIYDIFPTIMKHFGLPIPAGMRGKPIDIHSKEGIHP